MSAALLMWAERIELAARLACEPARGELRRIAGEMRAAAEPTPARDYMAHLEILAAELRPDHTDKPNS